jgi:hypothetical protein
MDYSVSIRCSGIMCLASRWLAMHICSGSTILAFWRYVTIYSPYNENNLIAYMMIATETHLSNFSLHANFYLHEYAIYYSVFQLLHIEALGFTHLRIPVSQNAP